MAKVKPVKNKNINVVPPQPLQVVKPTIINKKTFSISSFPFQASILALIALIFYANTFQNGFAFDDKLVITQNEYVQQGISGIPKILTANSYESFAKQQKTGNPLTGGRYRPLSIITFAIEQQLLGVNVTEETTLAKQDANTIKEKQEKIITDMHYRHIINVILYIISIIILLNFLRIIVFPNNAMAAFITALIFTIHPIHTEVVANVKSRDEILSLLFLCLTFIFAFRYLETKKPQHIILSLTYYFLALLSKEYGVAMLLLLPLSFYLFKGFDISKSLKATIIYLIPFSIYLLLRTQSVIPTDTNAMDEIMNNPYLYATQVQRVASITAIMLNYIQLLFFPNPLAADYSYNQIPYTDFSNLKVWASLICYLGLVVLMIWYLKKKNILCFAIAIYLVFLSLICNIFVNIGAPMGERLIYHSSLGFAIVLGWFLELGYKMIQKPQTAKVSLFALLCLITVLSGFKTIERNKDWASDTSLFLRDVQTVPNSIIANSNAGASCLDMSEKETDTLKKLEWYKKGLLYEDKVIHMHSKYILAYLNRGICYFKLGEYDKSLADCDTVRKYFPTQPSLAYLSYILSEHYFNIGLTSGKNNLTFEAIYNFKKALEAAPTDPDIWYNLGYAFFMNHQYTDAQHAFTNTLKINPNFAQAKNMLTQLDYIQK